jgi:ankyrin repeat protein
VGSHSGWAAPEDPDRFFLTTPNNEQHRHDAQSVESSIESSALKVINWCDFLWHVHYCLDTLALSRPVESMATRDAALVSFDWLRETLDGAATSVRDELGRLLSSAVLGGIEQSPLLYVLEHYLAEEPLHLSTVYRRVPAPNLGHSILGNPDLSARALWHLIQRYDYEEGIPPAADRLCVKLAQFGSIPFLTTSKVILERIYRAFQSIAQRINEVWVQQDRFASDLLGDLSSATQLLIIHNAVWITECLDMSFSQGEIVVKFLSRTALHAACESPLFLLTDEFLEFHANDIETNDRFQMTPLLVAVSAGNLAAVRMLCDRGANFKANDLFLRNALDIASGAGHNDIVQFLVRKGCPVNERQRIGRSAVFAACANGKASTVRVLSTLGMNPLLQQGNGQTPSQVARTYGNNDAAEFLEREAVSIWTSNTNEIPLPDAIESFALSPNDILMESIPSSLGLSPEPIPLPQQTTRSNSRSRSASIQNASSSNLGRPSNTSNNRSRHTSPGSTGNSLTFPQLFDPPRQLNSPNSLESYFGRTGRG